jgi:ElaB/YqjD/DUF883 family membrane-anchored ribosome-binding protein
MDEATNKMNAADWNEQRTTSTEDNDSHIASGSSEAYDEENTEQIRAEIEDTRAEMSQTINEIQQRLSPDVVMDQVKEKVRDATLGKVGRAMDKVGETIVEVTEPAREAMGRAGTVIKDTGTSVADSMWRNPIPVALIGLGLGLLAMRRFGGNGYDRMPRSRPRIRRQDVMGQGQNMQSQSMSSSASALNLNQVKETASDLANRSTRALTNLSSKAKESASTIGTRFEQALRENPLAVGAVAVAAGTAVGLVLPATKFEHEYIGETSEMLVDKAQEVARDAMDKVQSVAQQQMAPQSQPGT